MNSLPLNIESVTVDSLDQLRESGAREGQMLEFKSEFKFATDSDKREMLADISSFANARGGDLLIGVQEDHDERGLMGQLCGISVDFDKTVLQLDESLRKGVNPRISGIQYHKVQLESRKYVLLIRVRKSLFAPHMVTYNDCYRIYGRSANSRPTLTVQEIRDLVLTTDSLTERANRFRMSRINRVVARETPTTLQHGPAAVMHLLPYESFTGDHNDSPSEIQVALEPNFLLPPGSGADRARPVFEGIVIPSDYSISDSYALVTREGTVEGVTSDLVYEGETRYGDARSKGPCINDIALLYDASQFFSSALGVLLTLKMNFPMQVSISLTGVRGLSIAPKTHRSEGRPIDADVLQLGTVDINEALDSDQWQKVLMPLFDRLANAAGYWKMQK